MLSSHPWHSLACPPADQQRLSKLLLQATAGKTTCIPRRGKNVKCLASPAGSVTLAQVRAEHSVSKGALFGDPFAAALASSGDEPPERQSIEGAVMDCVATRFIDDQLVTALGLVNMDLRKEYRQVVLVGCGMDTRPFRLAWPEGTLLFEVAPKSTHALAQRVLKEQQARVPRGCLFRRVPCDLQGGEEFFKALEAAGFRSDRLSVWGIQGLSTLSLGLDEARALWTQISFLTAYDSIILGEMPVLTRKQAENLMGEHGMLGRIIPFGSEDASFGLWQETSMDQDSEERRWLFTAQHKQLSLREEGIYTDHVEAANELDEDFMDNFS